VLVVRGRPDPSGPVMLAVHASPTLRAAAEFAFAEASLRGVDLVALHVRNISTARPTGPRTAGEDEDFHLAESLADLRKRYPDVTLHCRRPRGATRRTLVEASAGTQLVVVGVRGRTRLAGLLDPVGQAVLQQAHCPVAVVRC
jgi:nucleotide-binding universal stress UspA family protein